MTEQELREFEENIVKGANMAFQRLVIEKKRENWRRKMRARLKGEDHGA